jgi:hypothetical protein
MGSTKIIMLSGIYMILGMYSASFDVAHQSNFDLASKTATFIQAEQIARTGISLAMTKMGANPLAHTYTNISASVLNGSVTYSATGTASQSEITSTATFNDKTVVVKATFVFYNNRWRVSRLFVPPTA